MLLKMLSLSFLALQLVAAFPPTGQKTHLPLRSPANPGLRLGASPAGSFSGQHGLLIRMNSQRTGFRRPDFASFAAPQRVVTRAVATEEKTAVSTAPPPGISVSDLPPNAIITEVKEQPVWKDESLEFDSLRNDPRTPIALRNHLLSFEREDETFCHAFEGTGSKLSEFNWTATNEDGAILSDSMRLRLITDLLDAVNFMHTRGSAHLGLDATSVRIVGSVKPSDPLDLQIVGLGAGVSLGSGVDRDTYVMANSIDFHAPETLSMAVMQSTLTNLFMFDSWAAGVLLTMIAGSMNESPFKGSEGNFLQGLFIEQATLEKN